MGDVFRNFLDRELHEEEANDPQMKVRNQARLIILYAAIPIVPLSVLILIITMVSWNGAETFVTDLWTFSLLHPFLSCLSLLLSLAAHGSALYRIACALAILPQSLSILWWGYLYIGWIIS